MRKAHNVKKFQSCLFVVLKRNLSLLLPTNTGSSARTQVPTKVAFVMNQGGASLQSLTDL